MVTYENPVRSGIEPTAWRGGGADAGPFGHGPGILTNRALCVPPSLGVNRLEGYIKDGSGIVFMGLSISQGPTLVHLLSSDIARDPRHFFFLVSNNIIIIKFYIYVS